MFSTKYTILVPRSRAFSFSSDRSPNSSNEFENRNQNVLMAASSSFTGYNSQRVICTWVLVSFLRSLPRLHEYNLAITVTSPTLSLQWNLPRVEGCSFLSKENNIKLWSRTNQSHFHQPTKKGSGIRDWREWLLYAMSILLRRVSLFKDSRSIQALNWPWVEKGLKEFLSRLAGSSCSKIQKKKKQSKQIN